MCRHESKSNWPGLYMHDSIPGLTVLEMSLMIVFQSKEIFHDP